MFLLRRAWFGGSRRGASLLAGNSHHLRVFFWSTHVANARLLSCSGNPVRRRYSRHPHESVDSLGFLERHPLHKANGFGFIVMALMLFIFDSLKRANPEMLLELVPPLAVFILCAVVGMYVTSWIIGKILGVSTAMAYAISLTALYGFPADYIITVEGINALTHDPKERQILTDHMLAPMLVGGFVSVTMVSVLLAGIMVTMIVPVAS